MIVKVKSNLNLLKFSSSSSLLNSISIFFTVRDIFGEENNRLSSSSPPASPSRTDRSNHDTFTSRSSTTSGRQPPARRFISSILGGDIPYGSRGHVLTQAQRKEYPPSKLAKDIPPLLSPTPQKTQPPLDIEKEDKEVIPSTKPLNLSTPEPPSIDSRPSPPPAPEPVVRCSVIQRVPSAKSSSEQTTRDKDLEVKVPAPETTLEQEPEQEQPIDYHIPKRKSEVSEEQERRYREARRSSALRGRSLLSIWTALPRSGAIGKVNGIMTAAAGHGRSAGGNSQSGASSQGSGSSSGCGNSINFGGSSGSSGSAGMSGGSGAGGGMGGRDGRSNYGPNSPPTGSLPPFYESLKGGQGGMNAYNAANGNFIAQHAYQTMMATNLNMDCDTTQEMGHMQGGGAYGTDTAAIASNNSKHYSMLQNAAYGIILKDEQDLEYDSKMDSLNLNTNLLQNGYAGYDVNDSMIDIGNGIVDPLQFTATLTFSSPAEHALLDSLSDAVDLSSFLQRLPNDDQSSTGNELELSSTPSLTPDSVSITTVDSNNCMDGFPDHLMMGTNRSNMLYDRSSGYNQLTSNSLSKMYLENPPSYQQSREMHSMMQHHQQQHQSHHPLQQHNSHHHQQQQQQHQQSSHHHHHSQHQQQQSSQHTDHQLVINTSGMNNYDLDSHSNLSLPSPSSGSMDAPPDAKPLIQSVSVIKQEPVVTTPLNNDCISGQLSCGGSWQQMVSIS